jgi:hypothetical protein
VLLQLRIAGLALCGSLQDLRVKVAIQQSRTVRLYNPMLEARIKALGQRLMSTAARIGLEEPGDHAAAAAAAAEAHVQVCSGAEQVEGA